MTEVRRFTFSDDAQNMSDNDINAWLIRYICEVSKVRETWAVVSRAVPLTYNEVRVKGLFNSISNIRVKCEGFLGAVLLCKNGNDDNTESNGEIIEIHTSKTVGYSDHAIFPDLYEMNGYDYLIQLWFSSEKPERQITLEVWKS